MAKISLTDAEIQERFLKKYWIDGDYYHRDDYLWCSECKRIVDAEDHWSKNGFRNADSCMDCITEKRLRKQGYTSDSDKEEEEEDSD